MADKVVVANGGGEGGNQQYVSKVSLGRVSMEGLVRPFETRFKLRQDPRIETLREAPGTSETSNLCWGIPSSPLLGTSVKTRNPTDPPERDKPDQTEITWQEQSRKTKKIRVENPDDAEQYVMVERIEEIVFTQPSGPRVKLVFKNK